jgi:hypothetical protein
VTESRYTPSVQLVNTSGGSSDQFQVGDHYRLTVAGGPPNSVVTLSAVQNNVTSSVDMPMGNSDSSGTYILDGVMLTVHLGTWREQWSMGGVLASPSIAFNVAQPAPTAPGITQADLAAATAKAAADAKSSSDAAIAQAQAAATQALADQAQADRIAAAQALVDAMARYGADQTTANQVAAAQAQAAKDAADKAAADAAAQASADKSQAATTSSTSPNYMILGGAVLAALVVLSLVSKGK